MPRSTACVLAGVLTTLLTIRTRVIMTCERLGSGVGGVIVATLARAGNIVTSASHQQVQSCRLLDGAGLIEGSTPHRVKHRPYQ